MVGTRLRVLGFVVVAALVGGIFYPTLRWLARSWLGNPYYSHGFLVPLVSAYLIWRRRDVVREPWDGGLPVLAVGVAMHLFALPSRMHLLSALGLIVVIAGLTLTFFGRSAFRRWAFPLFFLVAMIPLPFVERLSPPLEAFVARYAAELVRALGVAASTVGSQVYLTAAAFTVGAPCSGLRSIVALLTLALLFAHVVHGPWWGKIGLLIAALPIAVAANLVRISSLFLVAEALGADAGLRYYHTFSSPTLFLLACALLFLTGRALRCHAIRSDV